MSIEYLAEGKPPVKSVNKGDAYSQSNEEKKQQWLSALEKESFDVTEDKLISTRRNSLRDHSGLDNQSTVLPGKPPAVIAGPALESVPQVPDTATNTGQTGRLSSATEFLVDSYRLNTSPARPAVEGQQVINHRPGQSGQTPTKRAELYQLPIDPSYLKKFEPYNVRLVRIKEGYALWLRDYSENYLGELEQFASVVRDLLAERGSRLQHIILNGKKIAF